MRGLFHYDGLLSQTLNRIMDSLGLSILWCICSLPIVTMGAATTALYYAVNKVFRLDTSSVWKEYWRAFRAEFKQATAIWLGILLMYYLLGLSGYCSQIMYSDTSIEKAMLIFLGVSALIVTIMAIYLFPFIARFKNGTKQTVKNCGIIALMNFGWSAILLLILAVALVLVIVEPLCLLFVPACYMIVSNYILERVFQKYLSPKDLSADS